MLISTASWNGAPPVTYRPSSDSITMASSTAQCTAFGERIIPSAASTETTASTRTPRTWWPTPRRWRPAPCGRSRPLPRPVGLAVARLGLIRRALTSGGHLVPGGLAQRALGGVLRDARLPRGHPGGTEPVVVTFGGAEPHRVRRRLHARLQRGEQLLLGPDQALPVVVGELVVVGHGQGPGGAGFHAQPAQDAAQVVDLVDDAVPLARRVALARRVIGALHVDGVGGAGPGAQLTADALLQPIRPAVQLVTAVEPRRGGLLLLRVLDGVHLLEHLPEGDAEALDGAQELRHR